MSTHLTSTEVTLVHWNPKQTERERGLLRAKARAHAARSGHAKRWARLLSSADGKGASDSNDPCLDAVTEVAKGALDVIPLPRLSPVPRAKSLDPFATLPYELSFDIERIISYWARPDSWGCAHNEGDYLSDAVVRTGAEAVLRQLMDPDSAAGIILENASLSFRVFGTSENVLLQYKQETLRIIRRSLKNGCKKRLLENVLSALEAALKDTDTQEATLHAEQLRMMLSTNVESMITTSDSWLLNKLGRIYYIDVMFSLWRGRPPVLAANYLPDSIRVVIDQIAAQFEGRLEYLSTGWCRTLTPLLGSDVTAALQYWHRGIRALAAAGLVATPLKSATLLYVSRTHLEFLRRTHEIMAKPRLDSQPETSSYWQEALARLVLLTELLSATMCAFFFKPVGEVTVRCGVAQKLKTQLAQVLSKQRQSRQQDEIILWSLYKAACWEFSYTNHHGTKWQRWFIAAFKEQANGLELTTWSDAMSAINKWIPTATVHPDGSHWFDALMTEDNFDIDSVRVARCCEIWLV